MAANGYKVAFWDDENVLELNSNDGYTLCIYTELYTF